MPADFAAASAAKSAIFDSATPSSHAPVSLSSSTCPRYCDCSLNRDHDGRFAGFFIRVNIDCPPVPGTCTVAIRPARSTPLIRPQTPAMISRFTSPRILDTILSSTVNPSSSNDCATSVSSATLIRSGGLFFTAAASRIAVAATACALAGL